MLAKITNSMLPVQHTVTRQALLGVVLSFSVGLFTSTAVMAESTEIISPNESYPDVQGSVAQLSDPNAIRILLSPQLETVLVSQMMGHVAQLDASLGAEVTKGQTLVTFDCAEANARMRIAQAERDSAKENMSVKNNLLRLDAAGEFEVAIARAELRRADSTVELNRAQMAHCKVQAPFAGRVVKVHIKPFQGVNAGETLLELVSSGPLKIRLNVPSTLLRDVQVGSAFTVDINETGRSYAAKITAINARIDAVSHSVEMEGHLDEVSAELLPGMSGVARFAQAVTE